MSETIIDRVIESLGGTVSRSAEGIAVKDEVGLAGLMDGLIRKAVFGDPATRAAARWIIWEAAQTLGIRPASIHDLYMAMGRGDMLRWFTVPAVNLRMLAYDSARAVFRAARAIEAGAFIFEIARSEIGYTDQRPAEYASAVLAAAIREKYRGPVFLQGDHFQASAKKYAAAPEAEVKAIRDIIVEAVAAGFFNIDIDTSTLVDLGSPTLDEEQRRNYELCADFTRFIRGQEPKNVTISIGGEIGEVGQKNSTAEDLDAFMGGYNGRRGELAGISKISIQTGTSHGGVVLPDGSLATVAIDFETLRILSSKARHVYGLGGAVQHGASTLPEGAFHKFVEAGTLEVHLATAFQSLIMDHKKVPEALKAEIVEWVKTNAAEERKPNDTEAQFIYKSRKKAVGPFKKAFWALPPDILDSIRADLENKFGLLFEKLGISRTDTVVERHLKCPEIHKPAPTEGVAAGKKEDVGELAD